MTGDCSADLTVSTVIHLYIFCGKATACQSFRPGVPFRDHTEAAGMLTSRHLSEKSGHALSRCSTKYLGEATGLRCRCKTRLTADIFLSFSVVFQPLSVYFIQVAKSYTAVYLSPYTIKISVT